LSAHVFVDDASSHHRVLCASREMLCERFGIEHVTIQVELREASASA
jgi:Co/Zn/Cd efflux system component